VARGGGRDAGGAGGRQAAPLTVGLGRAGAGHRGGAVRGDLGPDMRRYSGGHYGCW